jgi:hypothetical protein
LSARRRFVDYENVIDVKDLRLQYKIQGQVPEVVEVVKRVLPQCSTPLRESSQEKLALLAMQCKATSRHHVSVFPSKKCLSVNSHDVPCQQTLGLPIVAWSWMSFADIASL